LLSAVRTSVRRITFAMASSYPYKPDFALAHARLVSAAALTKQKSPAAIFAPPLTKYRHCVHWDSP
jgi:hypothetical protein